MASKVKKQRRRQQMQQRYAEQAKQRSSDRAELGSPTIQDPAYPTIQGPEWAVMAVDGRGVFVDAADLEICLRVRLRISEPGMVVCPYFYRDQQGTVREMEMQLWQYLLFSEPRDKAYCIFRNGNILDHRRSNLGVIYGERGFNPNKYVLGFDTGIPGTVDPALVNNGGETFFSLPEPVALFVSTAEDVPAPERKLNLTQEYVDYIKIWTDTQASKETEKAPDFSIGKRAIEI